MAGGWRRAPAPRYFQEIIGAAADYLYSINYISSFHHVFGTPLPAWAPGVGSIVPSMP